MTAAVLALGWAFCVAVGGALGLAAVRSMRALQGGHKAVQRAGEATGWSARGHLRAAAGRAR